MMLHQKIAIVSVYQENLSFFERLFHEAGHQPILSTAGYNAHQLILDEQPDLIVLDLWPLYPATGAMLLALLHLDTATRNLPVIVCAPEANTFADVLALSAPAPFEILAKPLQRACVLSLVKQLLEARMEDSLGGALTRQPQASGIMQQSICIDPIR